MPEPDVKVFVLIITLIVSFFGFVTAWLSRLNSQITQVRERLARLEARGEELGAGHICWLRERFPGRSARYGRTSDLPALCSPKPAGPEAHRRLHGRRT